MNQDPHDQAPNTWSESSFTPINDLRRGRPSEEPSLESHSRFQGPSPELAQRRDSSQSCSSAEDDSAESDLNSGQNSMTEGQQSAQAQRPAEPQPQPNKGAYTREEDDKIVELRGAGVSFQDIAQRTNRAYKALLYHAQTHLKQRLDQLNMPPKKRAKVIPWTPEEDKKLEQLYGDGLKFFYIAAEFEGRNEENCRDRLRALHGKRKRSKQPV